MPTSIYKPFARYSAFLVLGLLALAGCGDVFEEDLTGEELTIVAPPDHWFTTDNTITFIWDEHPDALNYQLQVAQPRFDSLIYLIHDSTVTSSNTSLTLGFTPGSYQWRIRPTNGSSNGDWVVMNLTVDSTSSLTGQTVTLTAPANPTYTNVTTHTFTWNELPAAERYDWRLYRPNDGSSPITIQQVTVEQLSYTLTEGYHTWSVEARNETNGTSTGEWSSSIWIDETAPDMPIAAAPADNTTLTDSLLTFTWSAAATVGVDPTPEFDSLFIHSDTTQAATYRYESITTSVEDSIGPGTWYWRVKATDFAGNASDYSAWRTLTTQ